MPTTLLKYGLLGAEDLNIGTGTFEAELSNGRRITLHQINLSSFLAGDAVDKAIYYTHGNEVGQDANLIWDTDTGLLNVVAGKVRIGTEGAASRTLQVTQNGSVHIRIENTSLTTGDVGLEWAINGAVDWNLTTVDSDSDNLVLSSTGSVSATPHMTFFRDSNVVAIGTRTSNAHITQGLIINQSAYDDHILQFQSTDVAHGITDLADTSSYGFMGKYAATVGGLDLGGLTEGTVAISVHGLINTEDTTTADNSTAAVHVESAAKSGTGAGMMSATSNVFLVRNYQTAVVIVKGDGDVHNSGGATAMGIYDEYDDVKLLKSVKAAMSPNYKQTLGDWVDSHMEVLEQGGVITKANNGYFISQRGWRGLLIDAINQLATRIENIESRMA
jgi:hypothetical protein